MTGRGGKSVCKKGLVYGFYVNLAIFVARLFVTSQAFEEAGDVYLRNVANELQLMNGISTAHGSSSLMQSITSDYRTKNQPMLDRFNHHYVPFKNKELPNLLDASNCPKKEKILQTSTTLGFFPAELATMYKKAVERGTLVKYNHLLDKLSAQTLENAFPEDFQNTIEPVRLPVESSYAYYFYPLETFHHELAKQYGFETAHDSKRNSAVSENKNKINAMNPIFVGLSSILGMALFFITALYFYPQFLLPMNNISLAATSRTVFQSELTHLSSFIIDAIDYYKVFD
ncbi:uncharacterized protein LOC106640101 [Copidosoma floridanum]|uniref:uncharacterized protein LOC106640101 n=1 Tax=Copidosoma floridanum TaxID=29053 RepID=UPI0006C99E62|nr:uncharacterized protein LOC106640101 [Copidosoma floridanum]